MINMYVYKNYRYSNENIRFEIVFAKKKKECRDQDMYIPSFTTFIFSNILCNKIKCIYQLEP